MESATANFIPGNSNDSFIVPHWYMYPPKGVYKKRDESMPAVGNTLNKTTGQANLYVHIPFCNMKCSFCTLFTSPEKNTDLVDTYIKYLGHEGTLVISYLNPDDLIFINLYVGGGTPSILNGNQVDKLMESLAHFHISRTATRSVEFSPESCSLEAATNWKKNGFNRVSLGVQSFRQELLDEMNRHHTAERCRESVRELKTAGFENINIDLIYGHRSQTLDHLTSDLDEVIATGANSVTLHPLAYRRKTGYQTDNGKEKTFSYELDHYEILFEKAIDYLKLKGWSATSAVSFSRNDAGHAIEEAEANGTPTIGLGAGARSYLPGLHISSIQYQQKEPFRDSIDDYFTALDENRFPVSSYHILNDEEISRRHLVLGAVGRGVPIAMVDEITNPTLRQTILEEIQQLINAGLLFRDGLFFSMTKRGLQNASYVGAFLAGKTTQQTIGFTI